MEMVNLKQSIWAAPFSFARLAMVLWGLAACGLEMEKLPVLDTATAKEHIGQSRQVEGVVSVCMECGHLPGQPLKLLLDKPGDGREPFAVLVPGALLEQWNPPLVEQVQGKRIRVHGMIEAFRGRPEITLTCPKCLEILP